MGGDREREKDPEIVNKDRSDRGYRNMGGDKERERKRGRERQRALHVLLNVCCSRSAGVIKACDLNAACFVKVWVTRCLFDREETERAKDRD
jgi:hypothetical protein